MPILYGPATPEGYGDYQPKTDVGVAIAALPDGGFIEADYSVRLDSYDGGWTQDLHLSWTRSGASPGSGVILDVDDRDFSTVRAQVDVAGLADGGFAITWGTPSSTQWILRYGADNMPVGDPISGTGIRKLAGLADGSLAATWRDENSGEVYVQVFDTDNQTTGPVLVGSGGSARIAAVADDGFVVTWQEVAEGSSDHDISAQRFDLAGNPVGPLIEVNGTTDFDQYRPNIAAFEDGGFVIVWSSETSDGDGPLTTASHIYGHRYDANGNPVGGEFRVNALEAIGPAFPAVAAHADGSFEVAWATGGTIHGAGRFIDSALYLRQFGADGVPLDTEVVIDDGSTNPGPQPPDMAVLDDGQLLIKWFVVPGDPGQWHYGGSLLQPLSVSDDGLLTAGDDRAWGTSAADSIRGLGGNDVLIGFDGDDKLIGGDGNDQLNGGTGADWNVGGEGNDNVNGGIANDRLQGDAGNDRLQGGDGNDQLSGGSGNDLLDGGGGIDQMAGNRGNDVYVVNSALDVVTEAADEGIDEVRTVHDSYTLGANLENLTSLNSAGLYLFGNALDNVITGGAGNDRLRGEDGNDTLIGGGGVDTMIGGNGNDSYSVDVADDQVVESATGGIDTVNTQLAYTLSANLENLKLTGIYRIDGTGNALANTMFGNDNNNVLTGLGAADDLRGGGGSDGLYGGLGQDNLRGGAGSDSFYFDVAAGAADADRIADFDTIDKIYLDNGIYTRVARGALNAEAFYVGAAAHDADDRIIYNQATGQLFYDTDGNGTEAAQLFAMITPGSTSLSHENIFGYP